MYNRRGTSSYDHLDKEWGFRHRQRGEKWKHKYLNSSIKRAEHGE